MNALHRTQMSPVCDDECVRAAHTVPASAEKCSSRRAPCFFCMCLVQPCVHTKCGGPSGHLWRALSAQPRDRDAGQSRHVLRPRGQGARCRPSVACPAVSHGACTCCVPARPSRPDSAVASAECALFLRPRPPAVLRQPAIAEIFGCGVWQRRNDGAIVVSPPVAAASAAPCSSTIRPPRPKRRHARSLGAFGPTAAKLGSRCTGVPALCVRSAGHAQGSFARQPGAWPVARCSCNSTA